MVKFDLIKNPLFILTMIYGSASMGIFTSFSFYYLQHFLQNKMFYFFFMYIGIIVANVLGLFFGFNISKKYVRILIYVSCIVQIIAFPLIYAVFLSNVELTVLLVAISGFFMAVIGLYLIPTANRIQNYEHRLRHNKLLWGYLYLGMFIFAIFFLLNITLAFLFGIVASIIGSIGLFKLISEDKGKFINFERVPIKQILLLDYLSYLVLFSMYFMFFFSMVSIIAFDTNYASILGQDSLLDLLIPLLFANSLIPLVFWYNINKRFPLKSIFNITYVVSSISLILLYYNSDVLVIAYFLELWSWSIYQIYIFVTIGDSFPGLRNIQPINFWWLMLALSVGLGIIFPLLISDRNLLLSIMLISMLGSIPLFSFLKSNKHPYTLFAVFIQTKHGQTLFEQVFSNFELKTEFLSGVFYATNVLFKESFKSSTFLRSIEYENKTLILTESKQFFCIAVTDRYDNNLRKSLIEISNLFEVSYYQKINQILNAEPNAIQFNFSITDLPAILKQKIISLELS